MSIIIVSNIALLTYGFFRRIISSTLLKDDTTLHISSELEDALSVLQDVITRTSSTLAEKMFYKYWKKLALMINTYLFQQLVLQQYFNYNGKNDVDGL